MGWKSKYEKMKAKYEKWREKSYKWRGRFRNLETEYATQSTAFSDYKNTWNETSSVRREDYDTAMADQQAQFQSAQMEMADKLAERDSTISNFNATEALHQKVLSDYGNLAGSVGGVRTNRTASTAYQDRWFKRPTQDQQPWSQKFSDYGKMTIQDQSTNV